MSIPSFTPTFTHKPWIDNVDRIRAAGADGFNIRFGAVENDLRQASTVVAAIDAQLAEAASRRLPGTQRLVVPLDPQPEVNSWMTEFAGSLRPDWGLGQTQDVAMQVSLPDGVVLHSLRVTGLNQNAGGLVTVTLVRTSWTDTFEPATMAQVRVTAPGRGGYDLSDDVEAAFTGVDNEQFRYLLRFHAEGLTQVDTVTVDSVELVPGNV